MVAGSVVSARLTLVSSTPAPGCCPLSMTQLATLAATASLARRVLVRVRAAVPRPVRSAANLRVARARTQPRFQPALPDRTALPRPACARPARPEAPAARTPARAFAMPASSPTAPARRSSALVRATPLIRLTRHVARATDAHPTCPCFPVLPRASPCFSPIARSVPGQHLQPDRRLDRVHGLPRRQHQRRWVHRLHLQRRLCVVRKRRHPDLHRYVPCRRLARPLLLPPAPSPRPRSQPAHPSTPTACTAGTYSPFGTACFGTFSVASQH